MNSFRRFSSTRRFLWAALFFISIFSYQNCARVDFSNNPFSSTSKMENGGVYGGKPTGTFYRLIPDFTCEQKEAPSAILEITETEAELKENKSLLCGASKQKLDLSLIDSSIYQDQIVGYLEGIFEGQSVLPTKIPSNLVEVWCKDRNDEQGIETITHFDRSQNLAVNRIHYSAQNPSGEFTPEVIPDSPVARTMTQNTVVIKDEQGFELTVHRDQPASQTGLFKAEMKATINGQNVIRDTSCRLGGSIDPSVWPSKQIVDLGVLDFKISPDKASLAFSSNTITGNANLYLTAANGRAIKQISPNLLSPGIQDFVFTSDSTNVVYRGSQRQAGVPEIFKVNSNDGAILHLGNDLADAYQIDPAGRLTSMMITGAGAVIYKDGSGNSRAVSSLNLNIVSLAGGTPQRLSAPFSDTFGVYGYNFSSEMNKVVYLEGSPITPDLFSVGVDGSEHIKITPILSGAWQLQWFDKLNLSEGGHYVVLRASNTVTAKGKNYVVALDGTGTIEIPDDWFWNFSNATETFAFLSTQSPRSPATDFRFYVSNSALMNLKTRTLTKLPALKDAFFTKDSVNLVGTVVVGGNRLQSLIYSAIDGTQGELCPGVSGTVMKILEMNPNHFIVVSYDNDSRILNIHVRNPMGACAKINAAVASRANLDFFRSVTVSPDQQKLLIHMETAQFSGSFPIAGIGNQLFYVPLNGKPAIQINLPVVSTASVSEAAFLGDSQSVLYVGDQVRLGEKNVFLWKASAK